ncbi:MAG: hypothetical protein JWP25_1147 [Bradyrhizobium sp.]|nr:hypothetical protein [Bradyrhizobium sp.]
MTSGQTIHRGTALRQSSFAHNWVSHDDGSRSIRRRLMAVLRMAHRTLGISRKRLGLGTLSIGAGMGSVGGGITAIFLFAGRADGLSNLERGHTLPGAPTCPRCGRPLAVFATIQAAARRIARGWLRQTAVAGGFGLSIAGAFAIDAMTSPVFAGTCVQMDAIGTSSAFGSGASTAATCGPFSIAIGAGSGAQATNYGVAIGDAASSNGMNSVAIGRQTVASGAQSSALGQGAQATQTNTTAVGNSSIASASGASAFGVNASAQGISSSAFGTNANASGQQSIAIGNNSSSGGLLSIAVGDSTSAAGVRASAVGIAAVASGDYSLALGYTAKTTGISSVAVGAAAATANYAAAFGTNAAASGVQSLAAGYGANASAQNALAFGTSAAGSAADAVAMGTGTIANSTDAVAIGHASTATGGKAVAVGSGNVANGNGAVAIGDPNTATGNGAVAQGMDNTATGNGSVAMGNTNMVGGGGQAVSVAGTAAQGAVGIGYQNNVVGQGAVAIGDSNVANGTSAIAVGSTANASAANAIALGAGATATNAGAVALGAGSVTAAAVGTASTTINGTTYTFAGTNPASTVSVGAPGSERTITNVAAGRISGSSTDAINGSQLFATNSAIGTLGTQVNNLGATTASTLGGGATYNTTTGNITGFSQPINSVSATGAVSGPTVQNTVANALSALNTNVNNTANIAVKYDAAGGNTITLGATGGAGAPAGGVKITNLTAGTLSGTSTDAVNGSQLYATNQTISNIQNGGGIKYFHANSTLADSNPIGTDSVAIGPNAVANNANDVALGSGSITAAAVGTASTTINGTTYTFAGTNPASTVSVGAPGSERTITNVAAGRVSGSSTDAINGSQLFATNTAIDSLASTVTNINNGGGIKYFHANSALADSTAGGIDSVAIGPTANAIGASSVAIGFGSVASNAGDVAMGQGSTTTTTTAVAGATIGGTSYTFAGATPSGAFSVGSAGQERQIQNVAAGQLTASSTDAVNGSQLFATNQQVTANTTSINNLGNAITNIAGNTSTAYVGTNGAGIRYVRTNETGLPQSDAFAQSQGATAVGYGATASATDALALGQGTQVGIVGGVALGAGSVVNRPLAPATGTLPAGPATIVYNTSDQILLGAVSLGYSGAYRQITNVADGTQAQDAVTIRQLQGAIASVAATSTQYFHANSTGLDSLAVGQESVAIGPTTVVNGNNGIGMGNGAVVDATAPGGTAIGQNAHVVAADGISMGTNSQSGGVQSVAIGAGAVANNSGSVALGAGSVTQAAVGTSSTTINGTTYTFAGTAPVSTVSVGDVGSERTVTNVAAGRLSASSTDAVNGSQLYATNTAIGSLQSGLGTLDQNAVKYDTNPDGSKKNSVTLQGGDPNAPVVISNVAAGVADTDAVNVKQLNNGIASSKTYTDQVAATTLSQANNYTDQKFGQLNQDIDNVRQEGRQAAAIGLAAASLRYDDRPGKLSAAVGGGAWRGQGALAFGAGYTSENGRLRSNLSAAAAGGNWGVGGGLSVTLN